MIPALLNNKTVWYVLILASYSPGSGYTRKEIKELSRLDNLSLDKVLKKLYFHKIIKKEKRIIKLNFDNPETKILLDLIEQEKKRLNHPSYELFITLTEFMHLVEKYPIDALYLFGSHAKKIASSESDIDLAIFSSQNISLIKEEEKVETKCNKELQLQYFRTEELNTKNKLIQNILKDGIRIV